MPPPAATGRTSRRIHLINMGRTQQGGSELLWQPYKHNTEMNKSKCLKERSVYSVSKMSALPPKLIACLKPIRVDPTRLVKKYHGADPTHPLSLAGQGYAIYPQQELDAIVNLIPTSWAPLKGVVASLAAKMTWPDWDTRNHQVKQLGGKFSLRGVDKKYCSNFLYQEGLYDSATEYALTRSFENRSRFDQSYLGNPVGKVPFLNIVELINTQDILLCEDMLVYLFIALKDRKLQKLNIHNSVVESSKDLNIVDVLDMMGEIHKIGSGASVVPEIIAFTLLHTVQPYLWKGISINPLTEHTAADSRSGAYGDIEGIDRNNNPQIVVEVKHKLPIDLDIINIFQGKTQGKDIPSKFIVTTANSPERIVANNISTGTLSAFVSSHLQYTLIHERTICLIFVKELRIQIVNYNNLGVSIKQNINTIITSLLEASSP